MDSPGTELSSVGLHITTKAQVTAWASDLENLGELHNELSADPRHLSSETSERAIETFPHLELVTAPSSPGDFTLVAASKQNWWIPLAAMCVWFVSSITISLLNKELFGLLSIHIPCFVTGFHNFTMTVILFIIRHSVPNAPEFPSMHWATFFRYYFPIALLSSVDILATNSSFQFVSIGTITVIKSSLCVVTYCAGMAFGVERFEWSLFVCSLWILFSISLTVPKMEVHSVVGIVLLIVAVISSAIRWVWTQLRMQAALCPSPITPLQMMYVTVPANTVLLFTFGLFTEVPEFANTISRLQSLKEGEALILSLIGSGGCVAFFVVMSEFVFVQRTSSLSLTIAGVLKEVLTIFMSMLIFQERIGLFPVIGICKLPVDFVSSLLDSWHCFIRNFEVRHELPSVSLPIVEVEHGSLIRCANLCHMKLK
ncbi:MAG: uncharacterized protein KVP18_003114 [Porospora cf. gigantea A]|uniref:uncharacterized protein n=1 Tax=Porospora cf. gigantea A TaxID=2853593 RepID=UPI003559817A|nr:MAG: hypothetical protein KVP18_003114 [Porospora cf. gigantea A]